MQRVDLLETSQMRDTNAVASTDVASLDLYYSNGLRGRVVLAATVSSLPTDRADFTLATAKSCPVAFAFHVSSDFLSNAALHIYRNGNFALRQTILSMLKKS